MNIAILIITLVASAFFSGLEFAYISANKLKIELKKQQGGWTGRALALYYSKPSQFLGTILVGNNIALVIFSIAMANLLEPKLISVLGEAEFAITILKTLIATPIILLAGEFIPKNLFRLNPSGALEAFAAPFLFIYWTLWMAVIVVVFLARQLLQLFFGIKYEDARQPVFGKIDLQHYIRQTTASNPAQFDATMFEKALDLEQIKVRECMVPRTEIVAVEDTEDFEATKAVFLSSRHSKIPVYKDNINQIVGYIHHQDMLKGRQKVWEIMPIPETMPADNLLNIFITERKSIAWVVDEYGGTAGIVTLEDIIEEIFGEIRDEHDDENFTEIALSKTQYRFSARLEVDYLNEKYAIQFPEGDGEYETLAGYIVTKHGNIPQQGETIKIDNFEFEILKTTSTRIEVVKVKILPF